MQIQWQDQARELQLCSTRSPAVSFEGRPDKVPCARAEAMQPVNGHTQTCLFFQSRPSRSRATGLLSTSLKALHSSQMVPQVRSHFRSVLPSMFLVESPPWAFNMPATIDLGKFSSRIKSTRSCSCSYSGSLLVFLRAHFRAGNVSCCYADEHQYRKHKKQPFSRYYPWQSMPGLLVRLWALFLNFPGKAFWLNMRLASAF